jgi:hypothetical protein
MGTIKLELDLPDFKDHVEVKVIITRDGTVMVPPSTNESIKEVSKLVSNSPIEDLNTNNVQIPQSMISGTY